MASLKSKAIHHCANWDNGNCLGLFLYRQENVLHMKLRKKYANKPCQVDNKCSYFDSVVIPGMKNKV